MQIRKATLADVPAIMNIIKKIVPLMQADGNFQWNDTYPNTEVFEKDIAEGQLWVADIDGQIAGVSAITTEQYPEYADAGLDITQEAIVPHRVAVDPDFRGMGAAKALMLEAEHEAQRRNIKILRVDTNSQNKATQALFPKLGYRLCGSIGLQFRPGLSFLCYEKTIA